MLPKRKTGRENQVQQETHSQDYIDATGALPTITGEIHNDYKSSSMLIYCYKYRFSLLSSYIYLGQKYSVYLLLYHLIY